MVELNGVRIWAVALAAGEPSPPRKLACGTLARPHDELTAHGRSMAMPARLGVPGRPDLVLAWTGWFELVATGEVVAVYGATLETVGGREPDGDRLDSRAGKIVS